MTLAKLKLLLFLPLVASIGTAQVATARLDGSVQDQSGSIVPSAKIVVVNEKTQAHAETKASSEGNYIFPSLQPGIYTITAEAPGFRKAVVSSVELNVSVATTQRFKLEVGQVTESVVVEAEAARVQTTDAQIGRTVTLRDIDTLPQLARNPIILAVYQPGVQIDPSDTSFSRVNGMRQGSNNSTLDGIDINDAVVPRLGLSMTATNTDTVGEFRIITNGAKAEYGRNAGGQVELVSRSGSNKVFGNLFDYLRNTELNANNFFNNATQVRRPKYIQNQFGGSVGGPIRKSKTFFFFNYQGSRISQELTRTRTVLTPEAKKGLFRWPAPGSGDISSFDIVKNDPLGKGVDAEMAKIFKVLPDPNTGSVGDGLNTQGFLFNNPNGSRTNQYTGKVDHQLTDNHHIFFRYSWYRFYTIDGVNGYDSTFPGFAAGYQGGVRWAFAAGSDWVIRPSLVNEFRVGHQSANTDFGRPGRLQGPTIVSNTFTDPYSSAFSQGRNAPVDQVTDNLTKVHGTHSFKAGGTYHYTKQWGYNDAGIYPDVTTAVSLGNTVPTSIGPSGGTTISSAHRQVFEQLYNDVLGRMNQVVQTFYSNLDTFQKPGTSRVRTFNFKETGLFFQDDWKIRRNFTINVGLRWEFSGVPYESDNLMGAIDQAANLNTVGKLSNLKIVKGAPWYNNDLNNFAPRVGFAWDLKGDGKTAIRGSYGMFYDRLIGATTNSIDGATPGFSQTVRVLPNQLAGADVRAGAGIPLPQQPGAPVLQLDPTRSTSIAVFSPNLRTGYVNQYNLTVQREILRNTILEVGYVGSTGVKLFMNQNVNQPRIYGDLLNSFKELQAFQKDPSAPVSAGNQLVRLFGSPSTAISTLGATTITNGLVGNAASSLEQTYYTRYAGAGLSDYFLRNFPQYLDVRQGTNAGRSYYNSLQVTLRRNMRSLQVSANYTLSKSIDNASAEGNGYTAPIDSYNLALNRARSDWDRPHSFNGSATYALPFGKGKRLVGNMPQWVDSLAGGWSLGGLMVWQSGSVFTVGSSRATTNGVTTWANYAGSRNIGEVDRRGNGVWFFNPDEVTKFSFPNAGEIGNSGRNAFRGPRFFGTDVSLVKRFKVYEDHAVTFRVEGYNVLNNVNFANPTVTLTTPATFGKVSSIVGNPRIFQMALRYDF